MTVGYINFNLVRREIPLQFQHKEIPQDRGPQDRGHRRASPVLGLGLGQAAGQRRGEAAGPGLRAGGGRPRLTAAPGRAGPGWAGAAAPHPWQPVPAPGRRSGTRTLPFGKGKWLRSVGARGPLGCV